MVLFEGGPNPRWRIKSVSGYSPGPGQIREGPRPTFILLCFDILI